MLPSFELKSFPLVVHDSAAVMTDVHSKLAGPAESLVTEMKAYLLEVWIKLVKNAFEEFPRLSARVVEEVGSHSSPNSTYIIRLPLLKMCSS